MPECRVLLGKNKPGEKGLLPAIIRPLSKQNTLKEGLKTTTKQEKKKENTTEKQPPNKLKYSISHHTLLVQIKSFM